MLRLISSPPKLGGVRGGLNQGHTTAVLKSFLCRAKGL